MSRRDVITRHQITRHATADLPARHCLHCRSYGGLNQRAEVICYNNLRWDVITRLQVTRHAAADLPAQALPEEGQQVGPCCCHAGCDEVVVTCPLEVGSEVRQPECEVCGGCNDRYCTCFMRSLPGFLSKSEAACGCFCEAGTNYAK